MNIHGNFEIDLDFKMSVCEVRKVVFKYENILRLSPFWRITKLINILKTDYSE